MSQTYFSFNPIDQKLEDYFILHSGVSIPFKQATSFIERLEEIGGSVFYVYGPKGCGKTFFIEILRQICAAKNIQTEFFKIDIEGKVFSENHQLKETTEVVACYQEMKTKGGLIFFESQKLPLENLVDPHLRSRMLAGEIYSLDYPTEEELKPVLKSLLERHHLRLKDSHLEQILNSIPAIPEYFEAVSKSLIELIPSTGRLKKSSLREVLEFQQ